MGRTPGSQNKAKRATIPKLLTVQASKHQAFDDLDCPACGGITAPRSLGGICTNENCSNWHGVAGQNITSGGYRHDRFKVKELDGPRFNAAFMVIDYAV